jgi:cysteinyl-tRNA synthetase
VKRVPGEVLRWALLSGHYRAPLDWTDSLIDQSRVSLDRFYQVLLDANSALSLTGNTVEYASPFIEEHVAQYVERSLMDDLNTPMAFACFSEASKTLRFHLHEGDLERATHWRAILLTFGGIVGLLQQDPQAWFSGGAGDDLKAKVEGLLAQRIEARKAKDWAAADSIRDQLNILNIVVMDGPDGATWRLRDSEPT